MVGQKCAIHAGSCLLLLLSFFCLFVLWVLIQIGWHTTLHARRFGRCERARQRKRAGCEPSGLRDAIESMEAAMIRILFTQIAMEPTRTPEEASKGECFAFCFCFVFFVGDEIAYSVKDLETRQPYLEAEFVFALQLF